MKSERGRRVGSTGIPAAVGLIAVLLVAPSPFSAQQTTTKDEPKEAPIGEGPLDNDCFLPTSSDAGDLLRRGDEARQRARDAAARGREGEAEREQRAALDGWFAALEATTSGAAVWTDARADGSRRACEGVEYAVLRRLRGLDDGERARWTERYAAGATARLERAGRRPEALAAVTRGNPGTLAAARGALLLCDLALERGDLTAARTWLARGRAHLEVAPHHSPRAPELAAALARRAGWIEATAPPAPDGEAETWRRARGLEAINLLPFGEPRRIQAARRIAAPDRGVRPGLAFLDDLRLAIQTTEKLHVVEATRDGRLEPSHAFNLDELAWELFGEYEPARVGREAPGWAHRPVAVDGMLYFVHARTTRRGEGATNILVCLSSLEQGELEAIDPSAGLEELIARRHKPPVRWAISGDRFLDRFGEVVEPPELAELATAELQPHPIVIGPTVLVQARTWDGDARHWLLAFDRHTGELRWKRHLAKGADLGAPGGRFGGDTGPRLASMPLARVEERVFVGSHLGSGSLVDVVDGRLVWSVKNRRRPATEPGWGGGTVPWITNPDGGELWWAPADSDRLYRLHTRPFGPLDVTAPESSSVTETLFLAPPRPIGEAETLLGGDAREALVLGRAGAEHALFAWRDGIPDPVAALYLGPSEQFRGRGLVSETRVFTCTDRGLYLFDRERDLYLVDYQPLLPHEGLGGGDLYARGSLVLALGFDALWGWRVVDAERGD